MTRIIVEEPKFRLLPDGIYLAELKKIEQGIGKFKNPVYYPWFEIVESPYELCSLKAIINIVNAGALNSEFCKMVSALLNRPLHRGEPIDFKDLMGRRCYIKVELKGKNNDITQYIPEKDFSDFK